MHRVQHCFDDEIPENAWKKDFVQEMEPFTTIRLVCFHLLSFLSSARGRDVLEEACVDGGATFTEDFGNISSPNFPKRYANNLRCVWIIQTTFNKRIEVSFQLFRLELSKACQYDFLEIYDGSDRYTGTRFCGRTTPRPFTSSSSRVSVIFHSDGSGQYVGFRLNWLTKDRCSSTQYSCWNGRCIPAAQHCDNVTQCADGSDEIECAHAIGDSFDTCGKQGHAPKFTWSPRIVGGSKAVKGSWPWQVALTPASTAGIFCGGSIIHEKVILTAAHCVDDYLNKLDSFRVVVGRHSTRGNPGEQVMKVKRIIVHSQFEVGILKNDLAVVELEANIVYQQNVRPICFAQPNDKRFDPPTGMICIATGFGDLDPTAKGKVYSETLYQARLLISNFKQCQSYYNSRSNADLTEAQLCASAPGVDTCQGDSGGPLMCLFGDDQDTWYQVGVTSFGVTCAHPRFPGVYQRVGFHSGWIRKRIEWIEACEKGVTMTETAGSISSPNYPRHYYNGDNCRWKIVASPDQIIRVQFLDFNLHSLCNNVKVGDYLLVFDGSVMQYRYCGPMTPVSFTSKQSQVSFQFTSDSSGSASGFMIIWNMEKRPIPITKTDINPGVTPLIVIGKPGDVDKNGDATQRIDVFGQGDKSSSVIVQPHYEFLWVKLFCILCILY